MWSCEGGEHSGASSGGALHGKDIDRTGQERIRQYSIVNGKKMLLILSSGSQIHTTQRDATQRGTNVALANGDVVANEAVMVRAVNAETSC